MTFFRDLNTKLPGLLQQIYVHSNNIQIDSRFLNFDIKRLKALAKTCGSGSRFKKTLDSCIQIIKGFDFPLILAFPPNQENNDSRFQIIVSRKSYLTDDPTRPRNDVSQSQDGVVRALMGRHIQAQPVKDTVGYFLVPIYITSCNFYPPLFYSLFFFPKFFFFSYKQKKKLAK